jgi:hypothetical protein
MPREMQNPRRGDDSFKYKGKIMSSAFPQVPSPQLDKRVLSFDVEKFGQNLQARKQVSHEVLRPVVADNALLRPDNHILIESYI